MGGFLPNLIFVGEAEPTCRQIQHRFAGFGQDRCLSQPLARVRALSEVLGGNRGHRMHSASFRAGARSRLSAVNALGPSLTMRQPAHIRVEMSTHLSMMPLQRITPAV